MKAKKLKITIIGLHYTPEASGNAPYTTGLAEGLAQAGHTVHVLTGYPHYPEWKVHDGFHGWKRTENRNGVSISRLRHHVPAKPSALQRMHMELSFGVRLLLANWGRPDVVVFVTPALFSSGLGMLRAKFSPRKPSIAVWVQDLYSRGLIETSQGSGLSARIVTKIESAILGAAHRCVVIHERFRDHVVGAMGLDASSVRVVRNWTHLPAAPTTGADEFRKRMAWRDDDFVVLHAGNMGVKQGLDNVVEAAAVAQARGSNVRFVLMGDGNQRRRLEDLAQGISAVSFVASLPDAEFQIALTAADALLVNELPGVKDMSVPSKLTSYFNAGVPVIAATDANSVTAQEIALSGGGLRVDAADPSALVDAAEVLDKDKALCSVLSDNGLRYRYEAMSMEAAIGHYDEVITSLATSRSH